MQNMKKPPFSFGGFFVYVFLEPFQSSHIAKNRPIWVLLVMGWRAVFAWQLIMLIYYSVIKNMSILVSLIFSP